MLAFTIIAIGAMGTYIAVKMLLPHFNKIKITYTHLPKTVAQSDHLSECYFFSYLISPK